MIKHNPRLSFKDRYRLVKRVLKLALNKDSKYVNLLWQTPEGNEQVHTFYAEGTNPVEPFLTYMATVAGRSKTLEDMNDRAHYYLSKTTIAFTKLHALELDDYCYVGNPIRKKPTLNLDAPSSIKMSALYLLDVVLINDFTNAMFTMDYNEDADEVRIYSEGARVFEVEGAKEVTVFNGKYCSYITLEEIKYRVYQLKGFHIPS